ncbi:MAG: hypothetical protein GW772_02280 [Flavobacteriia bacterium]|nr:hypothetical protein [Flavobacteriia bacterium]OIP46125.1 MAG: hypothetical protein AUK46_10035 [Flavobacteriaceae bacterium CG2_30_31_66]PIV96930.1 MAG: hypothetical protein COW43_05795 [Flavobacteriaceae bacterium CG17_big_fil_post_rev_8_21_14_2_50_31_13]PIY15236.1 MAG: hypothetical protein COZ16_05190 [Flavobacteriaceae bacterium CG_4_10_14_3_um_filter_31_253]PIZ11988.1 MAG: hypothetical protein COY55_02055 [Flavobacteriaceae bacterium CG_4_10_14_0_8_um_filter_31_99]PJC09431.1 MAG: hypot
MRKIIFTLGLMLATSLTFTAQEIAKNALGVRFGGSNNGSGGEISYQAAMGENNRLEIDLGLANKFNDFKITGLYQWVWSLENRFNWYAGFGAGLVSANETGVFAAGVVGIEYNFDAPILISLDYRPEVGLSGGLNGLGSDFALALRYQF